MSPRTTRGQPANFWPASGWHAPGNRFHDTPRPSLVAVLPTCHNTFAALRPPCRAVQCKLRPGRARARSLVERAQLDGQVLLGPLPRRPSVSPPPPLGRGEAPISLRRDHASAAGSARGEGRGCVSRAARAPRPGQGPKAPHLRFLAARGAAPYGCARHLHVLVVEGPRRVPNHHAHGAARRDMRVRGNRTSGAAVRERGVDPCSAGPSRGRTRDRAAGRRDESRTCT